MEIKLARSKEEIAECFSVMSQLRTSLKQDSFVQQIESLQKEGYLLAVCKVESQVTGVAGFKIMNSLSWQKYLYVHDLVVHCDRRSQGYGQQLLQWLISHGKQQNCQQLHLDSGVQRFAAHRFYLQQYLEIKAYHFSLAL